MNTALFEHFRDIGGGRKYIYYVVMLITIAICLSPVHTANSRITGNTLANISERCVKKKSKYTVIFRNLPAVKYCSLYT